MESLIDLVSKSAVFDCCCFKFWRNFYLKLQEICKLFVVQNWDRNFQQNYEIAFKHWDK